MTRRAFTVIEVLAVVAILVVVTAISLPAVEGRLAQARFDAAVSRVDSALTWVRAESQRRGEPLKVTVRDVRGGIGLFADTVRAPEQGKEEAKLPASQEPVAVLDSGLKVTDRAPGPESEEGAKGPTEGDGSLIVAVFLPDGSAMASGPVFLLDAERTVSVTVNQWTGGVRVSQVSKERPAEPEKPEEP